mmetsp:Transcript_2909/g.5037  ORF Transcript_2909/g.5037 Transcript_2909/m.5037 type:complete len:262 (+) Transcript_2909:861-1646(+)
MRHLFRIDGFERGYSIVNFGFSKYFNHTGSHIEAARLQNHRNHGQPPHEIRGGVFGSPPHACMSGQGAIMAAHRLKAVAHQVEMLGFLVRRFDPIVKEAHGHRDMGKPGDDVPMQVDRVQLDMGHRMQQRDAPLGAAGAAAGHVAGAEQFRRVRAGGVHRRVGQANFGRLTGGPRGLPLRRQLARQRRLFAPAARAQHRLGHLRQWLHHRACTAARTASAWPGTLTLGQTIATSPLASIRYVVRSIPIYFLPYMFFSFQTP